MISLSRAVTCSDSSHSYSDRVGMETPFLFFVLFLLMGLKTGVLV
jgi:hypothetical protein